MRRGQWYHQKQISISSDFRLCHNSGDMSDMPVNSNYRRVFIFPRLIRCHHAAIVYFVSVILCYFVSDGAVDSFPRQRAELRHRRVVRRRPLGPQAHASRLSHQVSLCVRIYDTLIQNRKNSHPIIWLFWTIVRWWWHARKEGEGLRSEELKGNQCHGNIAI